MPSSEHARGRPFWLILRHYLSVTLWVITSLRSLGVSLLPSWQYLRYVLTLSGLNKSNTALFNVVCTVAYCNC